MKQYLKKQRSDLEGYKKYLKKHKERFNEIDIIVQNLYEDKIKGSLDERRFIVMMKYYEEQQKELKLKIDHHEGEIETFNQKKDDTNRFMGIIRKYKKIEALDAGLLNEFIEKIYVHEVTHEENNRNQNIYTL